MVDPEGPGSFTHPHLSRMLYADGKVITPLFKGRLGQTCTDKATGEIKQVRYEPDADHHFEGDGELAYGTKFVVVAARSGEARGRMILDVDWVPDKGGEAKVAMNCFERLAPLEPGAQGVIYDTALRGIHHQTLLRNLGLLPVNRVTAKKKGSNKPRRAEGRRVEKSVHVEDKKIGLTDRTDKVVSLFARGGAIGIVELSDTGEPHSQSCRAPAPTASETSRGCSAGTTTTSSRRDWAGELLPCGCTATRTSLESSTERRT